MNGVKTLIVSLYDAPIGTMTLLPGDRSIFAFTDGYLADENRPTLSLSFKDEFGDVISEAKPTQARLTPFFSNLLPEGHMREYLAARAGVKPIREFHLLGALGQDLPGAVAVSSTDDTTTSSVDTDDTAPTSSSNSEALRFSLAGLQMKFSAVKDSKGGLTIPVNGTGGAWIVKLPSTRFERVPENEFSMMTLARLVGIDVPPHKLVDPTTIVGLPEGIDTLEAQAFAIERFDRTQESGRLHIEDFAQVFGVYPDEKYEKASYRNIANVLWIETGPAGVEEFIRRLVFNTLIGNADMHLKNWSVLYRDRRTPSLAPAYDFVSTITYLDDKNMALRLGRTKKMVELSLDELSYLASKAGLPEALVLTTAREVVERFHLAWQSERNNLPLSSAAAATIDDHYRSIQITQEVARAH